MKGKNRKLVISLFISIIAICYVSLAISYAWFFANRAQDNAANNLKIVDFEGGLYTYKYNYENGDTTNEKNFTGFQVLNNEMKRTFPSSETSSNGFPLISDVDNNADFIVPSGELTLHMEDMLPNVRFLFLVKLRHNYENPVTAHFNINDYECVLASQNQEAQFPINKDRLEQGITDDDDRKYVSLSEAINIYIANEAIPYNDLLGSAPNYDILSSLTNNIGEYDEYEKFHTRTVNESGETTISKNIYKDSTLITEAEKALADVSIPASTDENPYYYVPMMFEFSNSRETFYKTSDGINYQHNSNDGNSNVYKGMSFIIKEFEITPYSK